MHQQPQYDQFLQISNFFPEQWSVSNAPLLYGAGCSNGVTPCPATPQAMDPRNRQIVLRPLVPPIPKSSSVTLIPGAGNPTQRLIQQGQQRHRPTTAMTWPTVVFAPPLWCRLRRDRQPAADPPRRRRGVLRPSATATPSSRFRTPPISNSADLRNGTLCALQEVAAPGGPVPASRYSRIVRRRARLVPVEGRRPDDAAVGVVARRHIRRTAAWNQPRTPQNGAKART